MKNFTPGPWEFRRSVAGSLIIWNDYAKNKAVGYAYTCDTPNNDVAEANACLIAAAPDGYALAEECAYHLFTKQDIDRVRAMAKEFLAKAKARP